MEEFEANLEALEVTLGELVELLPEEPATEVEAKAFELVARVTQHLALLDMATEPEPGAEEEEAAEAVDTEV
jgi:hypothetical protein